MFHKMANPATNAGEKTTANVVKHDQNDNKCRRKNYRKCGQTRPKRQQMPEKNYRKCFHKTVRALARFSTDYACDRA